MFRLALNFDHSKIENGINHPSTKKFECIEELIMDICDELSNDNNVVFDVEGFGLNWPVDVQTDLSTVIPQIDVAVNSLRGSSFATIQFFEQGIEKKIEFHRTDEKVLITCKDIMSDTTLGFSEESSFFLIEQMLVQLLLSFLQCARQRASTLCEISFFEEFSLNVIGLTNKK